MKIRKVDAARLDRPAATGQRELSPRDRRRLALEATLERVISAAQADAAAAFIVDLDAEDKVPTVRLAFRRVQERVGASSVNLFTRAGQLIIANRPQTRGRRRRT